MKGELQGGGLDGDLVIDHEFVGNNSFKMAALKDNAPKSTNYNIKDMGLSDEEIGAIWGKLELWDGNIQQLKRDKIYICVVDIQKK